MNPKLKQLWIDALESGNYKQGRRQLWRVADNEYCCLGVLGCILQEQSQMSKPDIKLRGVVEWENEYLSYSEGGLSPRKTLLPQTLASEVGLTRIQQELLAEMNDRGRSFSEIAAYIRENL